MYINFMTRAHVPNNISIHFYNVLEALELDSKDWIMITVIIILWLQYINIIITNCIILLLLMVFFFFFSGGKDIFYTKLLSNSSWKDIGRPCCSRTSNWWAAESISSLVMFNASRNSLDAFCTNFWSQYLPRPCSTNICAKTKWYRLLLLGVVT